MNNERFALQQNKNSASNDSGVRKSKKTALKGRIHYPVNKKPS